MKNPSSAETFARSFRHSAPYIRHHQNRTFVLLFGGEIVEDPGFPVLVHDIALLNSLGIRLVLVHGARPQIEKRLEEAGQNPEYIGDRRITDAEAMTCVLEAVGATRTRIEALLSMGLANTPMSGAHVRVRSGNFVTARPIGILDGVDFGFTGEVRRVDGDAIKSQLEMNDIVLLSPVGYSPTGETFNLHGDDVAAAVSIALGADKLIMLMDGKGVTNARRQLMRQLSPEEARAMLTSRRNLSPAMRSHLESAIRACRQGVGRVHLVSGHDDGALLNELFTRDGTGTLITGETYEGVRAAELEDVGGILELIEPLEAEGKLVRRSRKQLEQEITNFAVIERDGAIIACAALYPDSRAKIGELACMAVDIEYRDQGRGEQLLSLLEQRATGLGLKKLLVLTTQATHWFRERGFRNGSLDDLPVKRRSLYNYRRNSRVMIKALEP